MKNVRIVGVPEHFNHPWQMSIASGDFHQVGIDLEWTSVPEGTGKMCEMLRENQTDLAVILTEGIAKDISQGNPSVIIQKFVESPLYWGIHVAASSNFNSVEDLQGKRVAISRYGSGSQLMAIVHALHMNWDINSLDYVVVNTLEGAIEALTNNEADYFMWDRFMTQPIVDQHIFRRIGICPTPWPCFVIAARKAFYEENTALVKNILKTINQTTEEFKMIPSIDKTISNTFDQKLEDIQEWLKVTKWSQKNFSASEFEKLNQQLINLSINSQALDFEKVIK